MASALPAADADACWPCWNAAGESRVTPGACCGRRRGCCCCCCCCCCCVFTACQLLLLRRLRNGFLPCKPSSLASSPPPPALPLGDTASLSGTGGRKESPCVLALAAADRGGGGSSLTAMRPWPGGGVEGQGGSAGSKPKWSGNEKYLARNTLNTSTDTRRITFLQPLSRHPCSIPPLDPHAQHMTR